MTAMDDRALQARLDEKDSLDGLVSVESEQALLGILLQHNDLLRKVTEIVKEEHFSEELHRRIWSILVDLNGRGGVANAATMVPYLGTVEIAPGLTPAEYLGRLVLNMGLPGHAQAYATTVRDLFLRKQLHGVGAEMCRISLNAPAAATIESLYADLEAKLDVLRPSMRQDSDYESFEKAAMQAAEAAQQAYQRKGMLGGLSTGLPNLDDALGGLRRSDLVIIAGRPGTGKTSIATNIALAVALDLLDRRKNGEKTGVVGFASLEMGAGQLADRIIADRAGVPSFKIRKGVANAHEMDDYMAACKEHGQLPLRIDQTGGLTIAALKSRARSLRTRFGLDLLIVDYLQLLSGSGRAGQNRTQEVTEITMGLKALAKELDVPIIALSQLSRDVDKRDDRRPKLSDLRESGSIEQDADIVMFTYREEYYLQKEEPERKGSDAHIEWERRMHMAAGVAQIIIGKNRHGPDTTVRLGFQAAYTRFTNEPEYREELLRAPEKTREKKKALPAKAIMAFDVLRGLTITTHIKNDGNVKGAPRNVKLVDYTIWRERSAEKLLDPGFAEKDAVALMKEVVLALVNAGLVDRGGTKDTPYAWITEEGQKA